MHRRWTVAAGILFLVLSAAADSGFAGGHGSGVSDKTGVLLVTFGSSLASARASYDHIERRVRQAYPGIPVHWAYTSRMIRNKLAGQGKRLDSPETALAGMMDEGYTRVAVQSLHIIEGQEYLELQRTVEAFRAMDGFKKIILGKPLLSSQEDMRRNVETILANLPEDRLPAEAVVLMGHGTAHPANAFYAALMFQLQLRDPNIFIGTVEGYPAIDTIKKLLLERKIKTACLLPFMSVAGDHARNDMAGDQEDSWKSVLTRAGIRCRAILKGTADDDGFVDIWVDHLGTALSRCKTDNL